MVHGLRICTGLAISSMLMTVPLLAGQVESGPTMGQAQALAATIRPGDEIKVVDPKSGEKGYFRVYVPSDYSSDRECPVVLYYHGLGGSPGTALLKSILKGKRFIIVGMGYYQRGLEGYQYMVSEDVRIVRRVLGWLEKRFRIDRNAVFLAGFSKGGFYTSGLLNELPDLWAGAIILGAGARTEATNARALAGKPVFIGCGDGDRFLDDALRARKYYQGLACEVTFECWPGVGHQISDDNGISRWLFEQSSREVPAIPADMTTKDGRGVPSRPRGATGVEIWSAEELVLGGALVAAMVSLTGLALWRLKKRQRRRIS